VPLGRIQVLLGAFSLRVLSALSLASARNPKQPAPCGQPTLLQPGRQMKLRRPQRCQFFLNIAAQDWNKQNS
jgi:hypothetical protein